MYVNKHSVITSEIYYEQYEIMYIPTKTNNALSANWKVVYYNINARMNKLIDQTYLYR